MSAEDLLLDIFKTSLFAVNPYHIIKKRVRIVNNRLLISDKFETEIDLKDYKKIFVIAVGKASAKMAKAIEEIFTHTDFTGIVVTKYEHTEVLKRFEVIEAGHPIPDENSIKAGNKVANFLKDVTEKTLAISLISGGASALLCAPRDGLSLADKQKTTEILLKNGATIDELNCVRKHLSKLKGGGLLKLMKSCTSINLILSDVIGDRLDTIGSGLTYYDHTTFKDAINICKKYGVDVNIISFLKSQMKNKDSETLKYDEYKSINCKNILIASNLHALNGAKEKACEFGFNTKIYTDELFGEAKEAGKFILSLARYRKKHSNGKECLLFGGETTVLVKGSGKGGRNQEMSLSFLSELKKKDKGIYFLSAGTDGNDGPTDAAGAMAFYELLEISEKLHLNPQTYLDNNDSYTFFEKINSLVKTGPTNTNVGDIQIALILP